jgi:hypothetical protein
MKRRHCEERFSATKQAVGLKTTSDCFVAPYLAGRQVPPNNDQNDICCKWTLK